ncbi:MAG TPA: YbaK/EbsC family protein [Burkholderiales bacterium]
MKPPDTRLAALRAALERHGPQLREVWHAPAESIESSVAATGHLPGIITKNLLLTDRRRQRLWLACVPWERRVDMAALGRLLDAGKLQMAGAEVLRERLGVEQGALTLLALAAPGHGIAALVDRAVWESETIQLHPLTSSCTWLVARVGLERLLQESGVSLVILDVPAPMS